ncbi:hypothetical protein JW968_02220 [Candidatus Woesearchaeota archaeon]|nr:hypothetical protein [Candidatus Woesearchaeota archaeon]
MDKRYRDPLSEVVNVGAGNLATALSAYFKERTISDPIDLDVIFARFQTFDEIRDIIFAEEEVVISYTAVYDNGFNGFFMLLFPFKSALMISGIISKDSHIDYLTPKDEEELVQLSEVSTMAYLDSLNSFLKMGIKHHPVKIVISKAPSVEHFIKEVSGITPKDLMLFQVNFRTKRSFYEGDIKGLLILKDTEGLKKKIDSMDA